MKVNFSKLPVQWTIEGDPQEVDLRKNLGNALHQSACDIALDDLARAIYYSDGPVEVSKEHADAILAVAKQKYVVPVWQAIEQLINS